MDDTAHLKKLQAEIAGLSKQNILIQQRLDECLRAVGLAPLLDGQLLAINSRSSGRGDAA